MPVGRKNIATAVLYFHSSFKDNAKRDGVLHTRFSESKQTFDDTSFSCGAIDEESHLRNISIGRDERLSCYSSSNLLVTVKRVLTQWAKPRIQLGTYNAIISTPSDYVTSNHDWFVDGHVFTRKHRFGSGENREKNI